MDFERYLKFKNRIKAPDNNQQAIKYAYAEIVEKEGKGGNPSVVIHKSVASQGRDGDSPFKEYAIVSREIINAKGENDGTKLDIQCKHMQIAIRSIFGKHPVGEITADPIVFRKPYYSLFHCRQGIQDMVGKISNTEEQNQSLEWLTAFMSDNLKILQRAQESLVDKGLIDFQHLPIIFVSGCIIVGRENGGRNSVVKRDQAAKTENPECFLFHEISDELEDKRTGEKYMEIKAFKWGYNGSMFGLTAVKIEIAQFQGPRKITELECFPLEYLEENDKNELVPQLIKRGERWCENVEAKNFYYKGIAQVPTRSAFRYEINILPNNMPGRVLLDHQAFIEEFPELSKPLYNTVRKHGEDSVRTKEESLDPADIWRISSQITLQRRDLWTRIPKGGYSPTPAQALLCSASSPGYSLEHKKWGYFDIDLLKGVEWTPNPTEALNVDQKWKDLLKDLIMDHYSKASSSGIASGKGEGLIFLLYGPPGCGKTLTAELMAEEDKRALLRISCGDLGQNPFELERSLQVLLKLALRGSAIVLIDEADNFLTKRAAVGGGRDYRHNAIVSIFLKYLEYFPGVIFLTTNLGTEIDEAVLSRVIPLCYGPLNAEDRAKIWKKQLLGGEHHPSAHNIESICRELGNEYELDGREIKSLAKLSLSLCRKRKQEMSKEIIQMLYDLTHNGPLDAKK